MDNRIIELESKYSFQEDLLQELDKTVIQQQKSIDQLFEAMRIMKEQIADVQTHAGEGGSDAAQDERPPHY